MNREPQQLLRDSNIKPTDSMIVDCLGPAGEVYTKFLEALKAYGISLMELPISENAKTLIQGIEPNGRKMKFLPVIFDVKSEKQFNDIFLLAQFRKENI